MAEFVPCVKLWLEGDGQLVMSDYRMNLLALIAESGSLAQAAESLGLSYRRAWGKVKEIEANLGVPLVHSEVGGAGGGHTSLTPEGAALLAAYQRFHERAGQAVRDIFVEELSATLSPLSRSRARTPAP